MADALQNSPVVAPPEEVEATSSAPTASPAIVEATQELDTLLSVATVKEGKKEKLKELVEDVNATVGAEAPTEEAPKPNAQKPAIEDGVDPEGDKNTDKDVKPASDTDLEDTGMISKMIGWIAAAGGTVSDWFSKMTATVRKWLGLKKEESGVDPDVDKDTDKDANPEADTDLDAGLDASKYTGELLDPGAPFLTVPANVVHIFTSGFGLRRNPKNHKDPKLEWHDGNDVGLPLDTPLIATKKCTVESVSYSGGGGNTLALKLEDGSVGIIHHLKELPGYKKGTIINPREIIGHVGLTGRVTGPHLHLTIKKNGKAVDPFPYLGEKLSGKA
ncbi:MAG: M23 family metallopeptidase [Candidatus Gracilibacteria bacterium]